nr:MAG TPA: hypothetical protein [Bacteriophage sp.]
MLSIIRYHFRIYLFYFLCNKTIRMSSSIFPIKFYQP